MALSIPNLASEMKAEIEALYGAPANNQRLLDFCTAISKAIITHIKTNAQLDIKAADITIPATGLTYGAGLPVAGSATNSAALLSTRII